MIYDVPEGVDFLQHLVFSCALQQSISNNAYPPYRVISMEQNDRKNESMSRILKVESLDRLMTIIIQISGSKIAINETTYVTVRFSTGRDGIWAVFPTELSSTENNCIIKSFLSELRDATTRHMISSMKDQFEAFMEAYRSEETKKRLRDINKAQILLPSLHLFYHKGMMIKQ